MARVEIIDTRHTRLEIGIYDLQYGAREYDKFVYRFSQNGSQILAYTCDWATGSGNSYTFYFQNDDYLGNNWFAPNTAYSVTVDCWYRGTAYPVGPVQFRTDGISPPSGSIAPYYYPVVKEQYADDCVAMSLSTGMEMIKAKETGILEQYSVSFIYGSDGRSEDDMYMSEAIDLCKTHGSPRWELVATSYPDSEDKQDAQDIFQKACSLAKANAKKQAFTGSRNIDFYDCAAVASAIRSYGFFQLNYRVPYNIQRPPSTGIIPQPDEWTGEIHFVSLIGLTTINGKPHWIAQNSWGTSWGKNGIGYIPYDWGCGVRGSTRHFCGNAICSRIWFPAQALNKIMRGAMLHMIQPSLSMEHGLLSFQLMGLRSTARRCQSLLQGINTMGVILSKQIGITYRQTAGLNGLPGMERA